MVPDPGHTLESLGCLATGQMLGPWAEVWDWSQELCLERLLQGILVPGQAWEPLTEDQSSVLSPPAGSAVRRLLLSPASLSPIYKVYPVISEACPTSNHLGVRDRVPGGPL